MNKNHSVARRAVQILYKRPWVLLGLFSVTGFCADVPTIGKFMLENGQISQWPEPPAGQGPIMDEPINVIVRVVRPLSASAATKRLLQAMDTAGFGPKGGHTVGYTASIEGKIYSQLPTGDGEAFSNGDLMTTNDHGRFFGPMLWSKDGNAYFVGSFGRETPSLQDLVYGTQYFHRYVSFNQARDALVEALITKGRARSAGKIRMGNILKKGLENTGDHDGIAPLLELEP